MDLPDVARVIASYLDDEVLQKLYLSGVIPSLVSVSSDQYFWHDRVETLSGRMIEYSPAVDWKETYRILDRELRKKEPSFWNKEDNTLVLEILLSLGYMPNLSSLVDTVWNESIRILKFLLQEGSIDPSDNDNEALVQALLRGRKEAVALLLEDPRINPGDIDSSVLESAINRLIWSGKLEIVELFLQDHRIRDRYRTYWQNQIDDQKSQEQSSLIR